MTAPGAANMKPKKLIARAIMSMKSNDLYSAQQLYLWARYLWPSSWKRKDIPTVKPDTRKLYRKDAKFNGRDINIANAIDKTTQLFSKSFFSTEENCIP